MQILASGAACSALQSASVTRRLLAASEKHAVNSLLSACPHTAPLQALLLQHSEEGAPQHQSHVPARSIPHRFAWSGAQLSLGPVPFRRCCGGSDLLCKPGICSGTLNLTEKLFSYKLVLQRDLAAPLSPSTASSGEKRVKRKGNT